MGLGEWPWLEGGHASLITGMYVRPHQELEEPAMGKEKEASQCRVPGMDSPRTTILYLKILRSLRILNSNPYASLQGHICHVRE